ncbi:hypothetical protein M569_17685, partial [Genlisea aurea]
MRCACLPLLWQSLDVDGGASVVWTHEQKEIFRVSGNLRKLSGGFFSDSKHGKGRWLKFRNIVKAKWSPVLLAYATVFAIWLAQFPCEGELWEEAFFLSKFHKQVASQQSKQQQNSRFGGEKPLGTPCLALTGWDWTGRDGSWG